MARAKGLNIKLVQEGIGICDVAFASTSSSGGKGVLNQFVGKSLGYKEIPKPGLKTLKEGTWIVSEPAKVPIVMVVTTGEKIPTEESLENNLRSAFSSNFSLYLNKNIWIPLMGTGSGGMSLIDSLNTILDSLLELSSRIKQGEFIEVNISVPASVDSVELNRLGEIVLAKNQSGYYEGIVWNENDQSVIAKAAYDDIEQSNENISRPKIYKLSIGPHEINDSLFDGLLAERHVCVHETTKPLGRSNVSQYELFSNAKSGDYFYLCRGNREIVLIGQFLNEPLFKTLKAGLDGWGLRNYRTIVNANKNNGYTGVEKWWTPNRNSTFVEIPIKEYSFADDIILQPFFDVTLSEILNINYEEVKSEENDKTILIESSGSFSISDNVDGVLGVDEQAKALSELMIDLKAENGMMVGLFGKWGRGKTFFWKEIQKYLIKRKENPFVFTEFHAWKYQDTPASWAYLYETISKTLVNNSKKNIFGYGIKKNILRLNLIKKGSYPILGFLASLLITLILMFTPLRVKLDMLNWVFITFFGTVTIAAGFGIYKIFTRHIPNARELFKEYSSLPSFKELLGLQSEIQEELIEILNASFPNETHVKGAFTRFLLWLLAEPDNKDKRLLLFVDDIDRCSEDKIIGIIDSLKVMLEDEKIAKRIVVLTAIDVRVLKRAIEHKYHELIIKSFESNQNINKNLSNELAREYMDKLFISGINLGPLTSKAKIEIFDAYSKNKGKVNFEEETDATEGTNDTDNIAGTIISQDKEIEDIVPEKDNPKGKIDLKTGDINFEIEEFEYNLLTKCLVDYDQATPRSIRIYYYRYLLAKRLRKIQLDNTLTVYEYLWSIYPKKEIIAHLIIYYSQEKDPLDLIDDRKIYLNEKKEDIDLTLFNKNYTINRLLLIHLMNIVEIVVPY
jgi:hypothetical protein